MTAQPFPGPRMEPTAFQCDGCGLATTALHVHRRPNGDEHWLCVGCRSRAYGSKPAHTCTRYSYMDCEACTIEAEQRDREKRASAKQAEQPQQPADCGRST